MAKPASDFIAKRRTLIRMFHYLGTKTDDIVTELEKEGFLNEAKTWSAKRQLVKRDIEVIRLEDAEHVQSVQQSADVALREYIERQTMIFKDAYLRRDYQAASSASRDIAKAHGLETERPIKQEEDLLTLLKNAELTANKKIGLPSDPDTTVMLPPVLESVTEAEIVPQGKEKGH